MAPSLSLREVARRKTAGLHRALESTPGSGAASRFMPGDGDAMGATWRDFVARLEALPKAVWPQALDAACAKFAAYHRHFAALR